MVSNLALDYWWLSSRQKLLSSGRGYLLDCQHLNCMSLGHRVGSRSWELSEGTEEEVQVRCKEQWASSMRNRVVPTDFSRSLRTPWGVYQRRRTSGTS